MSSRPEITTSEVMDEIAEVLELEREEVEMESSLIDDLGADSLDLVDISFSLGKRFGLKLPTKTTLVVAQEMVPNEGVFVDKGKLTELGAQLLQGSPNQYSEQDIQPNMSIDVLLSQTLVRHWYELCAHINGHPSLDGDTAIQEYLVDFLEKNELDTKAA
ncbi:phosphopantetheine-binding protein [Vibrio rhizosphaerae]|uniref:Phosphopantetheine-binding protein n=1 Tax=Vibrio rhizosphaerae TaxID=398736 RepID=A0ABU4IRB0_9VIBR|nr:phosphopantetheine-binding protein [Vibrio rhizosphaerae]MDW6091678.1 phosphopantetheine-binding protein [Vibrio rhizosphaerae]